MTGKEFIKYIKENNLEENDLFILFAREDNVFYYYLVGITENKFHKIEYEDLESILINYGVID
jgi:hypothetical protein